MQFAGGEIGVYHQTRFVADERAVITTFQVGTESCGSAALPYDGGIDGFPCQAVPDNAEIARIIALTCGS